MINTLIPIQFAYAKSRGADVAEDLIQLLQWSCAGEKCHNG
jgi:hypothetical protein